MALHFTQPGWRVASVLFVVSSGCHSVLPRNVAASNYLVTGTPINVGLAPGLCIAIDPDNERGVWWWEAGASGCTTRSTGPGLFPGDQATVSRSSPGTTTAAFRLPTHSSTRPYIDVRVVVERGQMRELDTHAQVGIQPRSNLHIPEMPPAAARLQH